MMPTEDNLPTTTSNTSSKASSSAIINTTQEQASTLEELKHCYEESLPNLTNGMLWRYLLSKPKETILYDYFYEFWDEKLPLNDIAQIRNVYKTVSEQLISQNRIFQKDIRGYFEAHLKNWL